MNYPIGYKNKMVQGNVDLPTFLQLFLSNQYHLDLSKRIKKGLKAKRVREAFEKQVRK